MNEPKRRGRPPKLKPALEGADVPDIPVRDERREMVKLPVVEMTSVCPSCGRSFGHYDDCPIGLGELSKAQEYALRVWKGQSVTEQREWRVERVKQALAGQGLPFEGVVLP